MSQAIEACASWLQQRFGADVRSDIVPLDEDPARLWLEEQQTVAEAAPVRRREYAAGRACARRLLASLGFEPAPLLSATDRCPAWPSGAIGSIAHNGLLCAVAVARAGRLSSLGLDVEPDEPLEDDLWGTICTPRELDSLRVCSRESRGRTARLLFSAKECAYKCIYPLTRTVLGFQDMEIEFLPGADRFRAVLLGPARAFASAVPLEGFHLSHAGSILTGMSLGWAPPLDERRFAPGSRTGGGGRA